jgi:glyoxylate utilization-related uncharacterized protein
MSTAHTSSDELLDVGGEIVVQCLEGQVAITDSARTQNLHAGELLYLPAGEPHSVKGVEDASLLLSILPPHKESGGGVSLSPSPRSKVSDENEIVHARGVLLSVTQAVVLAAALDLLFLAVAVNIFAGVLVVGAVLGIFGCLHYWLWGRWMSPALHPSRKQQR